MAKNIIIMIGDGMGWEMARTAAIAKQINEGKTGATLSDFYTEGKGTGLNFQKLENYGLVTTYGTTIARPNGLFSTTNPALDSSISATGDSPLLPGFTFNPAFNPGTTASGGATNTDGKAVGNLVGYDPARGGVNPWTDGNDPEYIKYSYPDSANTATTLYTGVKSYNNAIGVDIFERPLKTILSTANGLGKSTGLVSSVPIDHATPGAAAANVNRRNKYDGEYPGLDNILQQELRIYQPTVLLGGGHPLSAPGDLLPEGVEPNRSTEFVSESTYTELSNKPTNNLYGYTFLERGTDAAKVLADTASQIDPEKGERLLGLYGARGQNGNLPVSSANGDYSTTGLDMFSVFSSKGLKQDVTRPLLPGETDASFIAREVNENPTLDDLTQAALKVLEKDKDGFWLMVEGGDIDWSAHDNSLDNLIGTMNDFDKAVGSTLAWIENNGGWEENLLIVTADHDHYLTLNPNFPAELAAKGAEALTEIDNYQEVGHFWGSNPEKDGKYGWGSHTNRPVPVYYQGAGSEVLTSQISQGYNSYGYDIAGIPGLADQVNIYQTMYEAVTGNPAVEFGTASNDTLYGDDGNDNINGLAGDDIIFGNEGDNTLIGGDGNDRLYGGSGRDRIYGGEGNNVMYGNEGDNIFIAGNGNNIAYGGSGDDIFSFGNGNNLIFANEGINNIVTGSGNDTIYGGSQADYIYSGAGNDIIYANEGDNVISAGTGNDIVYAGSGADKFILDAGEGFVSIFNFGSNDQISRGSTLAANSILSTTISGNDTLISVGSDLLATLKDVQLSSVSFV
ncbi:alkaline phosphatase [Calothrix sp. UHCC 0171]|uniref:alkaline phosphatase n=1 Tax=Calothrix sp. UHCC 0171 TaxID=3110245 RepID=UPI002B1F5249|nr:alkaline phosphatase [Calothrix sp. UHCC 0171]MEA5572730.1 alkaline phosphatase [Calothrix sp. UHCC 0171]